MAKLEIFDPAMCCSTGVCGPSVDPELSRVAAAVASLQKNLVNIVRYNLAFDAKAFAENEQINKILQEKGTSALPVTLVDGKLVKFGGYPTNQELSEWTGTTV